MTLAYPERPDAEAPERPAPPPPRFASSTVAVPPVKARRRVTRVVGLAILGLGALTVVGLVPWRSIPRDSEGLRNVGIPRQYRDLMDHTRPQVVEAPARVVESDDPLVSLTPLQPRPPEPPPPLVVAEASPAPPLAAMPAAPATPAPAAIGPPPVAPAPKPRAMAFTARATPSEPPAAAETPDPSRSSSSPSYRVQIAATGTDAEAEAAWRDLRRAFPDETQDRKLAITPATVNGRKVRRAIVAGFPSSDAAKAFCAQLAAADHGCLLRGKD